MSNWTHIKGTITVSPMGRTQAEKRYVLDTVLEHLPIVSGSEGDMDVYVIQKNGHNESSSCDEFGMRTNNMRDWYGNRSQRGWLQVQREYILAVDADLRDRIPSETIREFMKWLCRLSKRVTVDSILVEIYGDWEKKGLVIHEHYGGRFWEMFETPSWVRDKNDEEKANWCEYMLWDRGYQSDMPMKLLYKYYEDEENDKEVERRMKWEMDQYES